MCARFFYRTGLNGGLPRDLPSDHIDVTFHLRGAYGPCMSQMFAEQYSTEEGWRRLPLAPLRSHAEYLEFCRCLLDEASHQQWATILRELGFTNPEQWVVYAAQFCRHIWPSLALRLCNSPTLLPTPWRNAWTGQRHLSPSR